MDGRVRETAEAMNILAQAMRKAGVASATFTEGPVQSLLLAPEPLRIPDTDPAPVPDEQLTPEEAARKAQAEYDAVLYASS